MKIEHQAIVAENDVQFNYDLARAAEQGWEPKLATFQVSRGDYVIIAIVCTRESEECPECKKVIYGTAPAIRCSLGWFHEDCFDVYWAKRFPGIAR